MLQALTAYRVLVIKALLQLTKYAYLKSLLLIRRQWSSKVIEVRPPRWWVWGIRYIESSLRITLDKKAPLLNVSALYRSLPCSLLSFPDAPRIHLSLPLRAHSTIY